MGKTKVFTTNIGGENYMPEVEIQKGNDWEIIDDSMQKEDTPGAPETEQPGGKIFIDDSMQKKGTQNKKLPSKSNFLAKLI